MTYNMTVAVHWFRNGLRLHDNPALIEAVNKADKLITLFIFEENMYNTDVIGYHPMRFLLESLDDLNTSLTKLGGCLYILQGNPVKIFNRIKEEIGLNLITYEQDCAHNGRIRDELVVQYCNANNVQYIEKVSHTLWNPKTIIDTNGGEPPLTFKKFQTLALSINKPLKPINNVDWSTVSFGKLPVTLLEELKALDNPTTQDFGIVPEAPEINNSYNCWYGGETKALEKLTDRLNFEKEAFVNGFYLPNQINPNLLDPSYSLSAALRYGCLSIRKLYWELSKLFIQNFEGDLLPQYSATSQLIWRDHFYSMSFNNEYFDQMEDNMACLKIPWNDIETGENKQMLEYWKTGKTGYPFIDAGMRQLLQEGWVHHVVRNSLACFLTRGDLWISWTEGLKHFLKYLIDADYSVCSGNWIWVSSSTFEQILDCPLCICPVSYGVRLDPSGEYIRRYVPELKNMPDQYLNQPWKCPDSIQKEVGCIIGKDYPHRIVEHTEVARENRKKMQSLRISLMNSSMVPHCRPSDQTEVKQFMHLPEECMDQLFLNDNLTTYEHLHIH
ncbi:Rossmann-like alpha/beta/alpha sandwich fold,Cryptochrome/DNA photolyase class 1,DNA photolyase, N- [Cinara cedri]|uniref:Cryptochrome-1 n=1 Tax=Cinara cedri TaxID=506608 RepID=A0A5E4MN25_9HEMI|nr:Rossmann-like alpha/beta/alpha sandwich fold,Cryptochrome/DNA photolyase class 1,DNA photolyase, N- [Cinara cedri]